jgi:phosphoglycerol transferase MdoB-like AlkP superfamily enzyme
MVSSAYWLQLNYNNAMNFHFLKNYSLIFIVAYFTILSSKVIFALYLRNHFIEYSYLTQLYAILWGYKFDFAISAFISLFITLFDFNKRLLVLLSSLAMALVLSIQISDIMYFYESSRHTGYEVSDIFIDANSLLLSAISQHGALSALFIVVSVFILWFSYSLFNKKIVPTKISKWIWVQKITLLLVSIFFIRGTTLVGIPLDPYHANQIGDAKLAMLSLNATYNITHLLIRSKRGNIQPIKLPKLSNLAIKETLHKLYNSQNNKPQPPTLKRPNIVFFFLESWSGVHMSNYGANYTATPFFDAILKKSIRPKGMIASGHRTSEGVFSTLTSQQNPLGKTIAQTKLQSYPYHSIVDIFNQDNYYTAFYQGSSKETSGVGSLVQKLGFRHSFGKRDVKNRRYLENSWGVHDPDLYQFVKDDLHGKKQPFFIGINGATTHDEQLPDSIKSITFTSNKELNIKLNTLHFSDAATHEFMQSIKKQYPNTLFVFFADHVGGIKGGSFDNYLIPFAVHHQDLTPKYYNSFISQRDIAPTILDLVYGNYHEKMPSASGKSLISDTQFFADYYHNGVLGWIEENKLVEYNIALNKKYCYKINTFKPTKTLCNEQYNTLLNRLIAFTNASQSLLFKGNTEKFHSFRNTNAP